jgi:hypothetical protein
MFVRNLWTLSDLRQKEWSAYALHFVLYSLSQPTFLSRGIFNVLCDPARARHLPPPTPFEHAINYLVKIGDKARRCGNPECDAPYFIAKRKNQKYCTEKCAGHGQRELKRSWWAEHGEKWRKERQFNKQVKGGRSSKQLKEATKKVRKK